MMKNEKILELNAKIKYLNKIIQDKEQAMSLQIKETDRIRQENLEIRTLLKRLYWLNTKVSDTIKQHQPKIFGKYVKELSRIKIRFLKQEIKDEK